jgi:hypothetical protein
MTGMVVPSLMSVLDRVKPGVGEPLNRTAD